MRFVLWAFVTRACSWSTGRCWYYALHVINLCANSIFTLLRFWHLLLPFTLMLWLIMNDNINGNEKVHPSTVAVISHSPVSWHQRTNNVQYRWHLSCITLCKSSSFVESCFYIFFSCHMLHSMLKDYKYLHLGSQFNSPEATCYKKRTYKRPLRSEKKAILQSEYSQAPGSRLLASAFDRSLLTPTVHGSHYDIQTNSLDQLFSVEWNIKQGCLHPMRNN